jgi:DnaJ-class molecular chaperone
MEEVDGLEKSLFETECENCRGSGLADGGICIDCCGQGTVLTELGERIIDLILRRVGNRLFTRNG